jgi:hypothetical protein
MIDGEVIDKCEIFSAKSSSEGSDTEIIRVPLDEEGENKIVMEIEDFPEEAKMMAEVKN